MPSEPPTPPSRVSRELRSFGRIRGRKLSARQQRLIDDMLPRLALTPSRAPPASLTALFPVPVRDVWLEIGFGGAEHLVWQAEHNADVGFIGCEPFEEGVVKALTAVEERGLDSIRLHAGDAREVLRWLPDASIGRVFVLFPDPWPKRRHVKRRLVNPEFLAQLARVMRPGAELRLATDIGDYARAALAAIARCHAFAWTARRASDWRVRPADWPQTRYEAKAMREGRRCYYFTFRCVRPSGAGK
jgi:tRNA (guanine-N7-)-methyltransferase